MPQTNDKNTLYVKILRQTRDMKSKIKEDMQAVPLEMENLYTLAFMGLLRSGCKYTKKTHIETSDEFVPQDGLGINNKNEKPGLFGKKKNKNDTVSASTVTHEKDKITIYSIRIDDDIFECAEDALYELFGSLFTEFLNPSKRSSSTETNEQESSIIRPNFDEDDIDDIPEEEMFSREKAEKTKSKPKIPLIESDPRYPDDELIKQEGGMTLYKKEDNTFLYDRYQLELSIPQGDKSPVIKKCMVFVYPLEMMDQNNVICDTVVYVSDSDMRVRARASSYEKEESKIIAIDFTQYKFYVSGKWENGDFVSNVILEQNPKNKSQAVEVSRNLVKIRPEKRTSSFYQRIKSATGEYLDIFPLSLGGNEPNTGIAPIVAMLENGYTRDVLTKAGNGLISVIFEGKKKTITPYWQGHDLICQLEDFKNELDYD